jgi:hypothetical protein
MKMRFLQILVTLVAMTGLSGCYVVPVRGADGSVVYQTYPFPPAVTPVGTPPATVMPVVLNARLYPANELATQTGMIVGTVTNLMTGKGRFQVNYQGEILTGEATRVSNEERRGVASAYSPKGAYMSCDYQMNTPYQGVGNCTFSDGARYQMHLNAN